MYPRHYFDIVPPFPMTDRVFVIMSFHPKYNDRWSTIIKPAIEDGTGLEAYRVLESMVGDSIVTEITDGIAKSRLIFADISGMGELNIRDGDRYPYVVRNGNAMYELGMAQSTRQPTEVIVYRDDTSDLPFDVKVLRAKNFDPDAQPDEAKRLSGNDSGAIKRLTSRQFGKSLPSHTRNSGICIVEANPIVT